MIRLSDETVDFSLPHLIPSMKSSSKFDPVYMFITGKCVCAMLRLEKKKEENNNNNNNHRATLGKNN
jgi:hypothetical protein